MMGVLRQALVPDFGKTKLGLHHAEDMFDFGAHFRLVTVPGPLSVTERNVPTTFFVCEVFRLWRMLRDHIFFACIGRITPDASFVTMEQITQHDRVVNIGRCSYNGMNQLGFAVDTDMGLHCKEPLIALAGLVHLQIALLLFVFGRAWRVDNTSVNESASINFQTIFLQVFID